MIEYLAEAATLGALPDAVLVDAWSPGQSGGTGRDDRRRTSCDRSLLTPASSWPAA